MGYENEVEREPKKTSDTGVHVSLRMNYSSKNSRIYVATCFNAVDDHRDIYL